MRQFVINLVFGLTCAAMGATVGYYVGRFPTPACVECDKAGVCIPMDCAKFEREARNKRLMMPVVTIINEPEARILTTDCYACANADCTAFEMCVKKPDSRIQSLPAEGQGRYVTSKDKGASK